MFRGLTLDMDQDPLSDIHVRRALYYATDREGIAEGLFPGQAVAANTLNMPDLFAGILPDDEITAGYDEIATFPYDIDKAKEEMAQSSVPDGFDITVNVPDDSTAAITIMQAVKESWSQIGVNVDLNLMPGGPRFQTHPRPRSEPRRADHRQRPRRSRPDADARPLLRQRRGRAERQQLVELPRRRGRRDDRRRPASRPTRRRLPASPSTSSRRPPSRCRSSRSCGRTSSSPCATTGPPGR